MPSYNKKMFKNGNFEPITALEEANKLNDWLEYERSPFYRIKEIKRVIEEAEERGIERYLVLKTLEQQ